MTDDADCHSCSRVGVSSIRGIACAVVFRYTLLHRVTQVQPDIASGYYDSSRKTASHGVYGVSTVLAVSIAVRALQFRSVWRLRNPENRLPHVESFVRSSLRMSLIPSHYLHLDLTNCVWALAQARRSLEHHRSIHTWRGSTTIT